MQTRTHDFANANRQSAALLVARKHWIVPARRLAPIRHAHNADHG